MRVLSLLDQYFWLNGSESPRGTLKTNHQKRFIVILNVLEKYYTSYDTVKAPSQELFSADLGCFLEFKKFVVLVAHIRKFHLFMTSLT